MKREPAGSRPRSRESPDVGELYRAAEFAAAAIVLDERLRVAPQWSDLELRARIELRRDPAAAIVLLEAFRSSAEAPLERAVATMLEGVGLARLGDVAAALALFDRAASLVPRGRLAAGARASAEIGLQRAVAHWIARDLEAARGALPPVDDPRADAMLQIEIAIMHGAVAATAGRFAEHGAILLDAAARLRSVRDVSVLHRAGIASRLAFLSREVPNGELARVARAEYDAVVWPSGGDLDDVRYQTLRSLAWTHAIGGDYFTAFRSLKAASLVASSDAWRAMASADRAYLAASLDEPRFAEQEFDDAREYAERVRWENSRGEERFALLVLAELAASRDPSLALGYVARYRKEGAVKDRVLASSDDRRVDAMESYSIGIVRAALGDRDEAVRLFTRAWEIYHEIGYVFREGRTAVALAVLTNEDGWQKRAEHALASFDRRWLLTPIERAFAIGRERERHAATDTHADDRLTPAQDAVYRLLLEGYDAEEVARRLGRSTNTVRNHIKAVYRAFDVRSRGALLARARKASVETSADP